MWVTPGPFKSLTNFTLGKFEKLAQLVVLTIINHVRSTGESHCTFWRPTKMAIEQHLLSFILFMKHNNVIKYDACM